MKKYIRVLTAVVLLVTAMIPAAVFGASSTVSILGNSSAKVGETVTITVTYKGASLGYVNGQLTYDNSRLEYVSGGSSQGDAGLVELKSYAGDASGKMSFKLSFRAVGSGTVALNLQTLETQNLDGDQDLGTPSAKKTVKVSASQTEPSSAEKENTEETDAETAETETLISDDMKSQNSDQDQKNTSGSVGYTLLGGIAGVILVMIVMIALRLKKKKR